MDSLISNQSSLSARETLLSASYSVTRGEFPCLGVVRWYAGDAINILVNSLAETGRQTSVPSSSSEM